MAWTTPTTRATGDLITASIYNTDLVNNIQYLFDHTGRELGYAEKTTDTSITATTTGTANNVATTASITLDGATTVLIHLSCVASFRGTNNISGVIYEDSSYVTTVFYNPNTAAPSQGFLRRTPSAGSHTYSFRAYVDAGTGTINATSLAASFVRVTSAA